MDIEKICLKEIAFLLDRDLAKYGGIIAKMLGAYSRDPELGLLMLCPYLYCRKEDDVGDEDREIALGKMEHLSRTYHSMITGDYTGAPEITLLHKYTLDNIIPHLKEGDDPAADFIRLFDKHILYDVHRKGVIMTQENLEQYFIDSFEPVQNIALIISGSNYRGTDFNNLQKAMGYIYSVRDREIDMDREIINIPKEVISHKSDYITNHQNVTEWDNQQLKLAKDVLNKETIRLRDMDQAARNVCMPLIYEMNVFLKDYFKLEINYLIAMERLKQ